MRLPAVAILSVVLLCGSAFCLADDILHRYECDTVPYDPLAGWIRGNPCDGPCVESVNNGHFVLHWFGSGDLASYGYGISPLGVPPPPSLWLEWRFRSNKPLGTIFFDSDAQMSMRYAHMLQTVNMYGDAAISQSGSQYVLGLALNEFHTYRFESLDGIAYHISVGGKVFIEKTDDLSIQSSQVQMRGQGGSFEGPEVVINAWDFVRYGTISFGEQIIAADPPAGMLDATVFNNLDHFTVTYDSPNYAYIDDISVEVTGGDLPAVIATRRLDNGDPEVLEIVLDRPMPVGETTRFTFNDGTAVNVVEYTLTLPDADNDGVPDEEDNCPDHPNPRQADCDNDSAGDDCTIAECTGDPACADCNGNGVPDGCDISEPRTSVRAEIHQPSPEPRMFDQNRDREGAEAKATQRRSDEATKSHIETSAVSEERISSTPSTSTDCNNNSIPDECDIASGLSPDCDANAVPDECQPDTDGDGAIDPCDPCPQETVNDQDGDGLCFPADHCPTDPTKTTPGQCGCGVSDTDSDADTIADCLDNCPNDPAKTSPGLCGCGVADTDSDGDAVPDCLDQCPEQDDRIDKNQNNISDCAEKPVVPAASVWGLVVLALALLCVFRINRRRFSLGS